MMPDVIPCKPRISIVVTDFVCRVCDAFFEAETLQMVSIDVWMAHLKTIRCPQCGSAWKKLSLVDRSRHPAFRSTDSSSPPAVQP